MQTILYTTTSMEDPTHQSPIDILIDSPNIETKNKPQAEVHEHTSKEPAAALVLTRLHAGYFRISLSFSGQVLLWKTLNDHLNKTQALHKTIFHVPSMAFVLLWWLSLLTLVLLSLLYVLRCIFHFKLVKAEFSHHVGANYLFVPWISWLLLLQTTPFGDDTKGGTFKPYHHVLWWFFVIPIVALDIKIYGRWFTTEKRFLSMVANPTSQISVMGNLAGAWSAARMGRKESAMCVFTLGLAHYLVLFITLYQRLSGADRFPAMLRPVFFLFVAAPSMASLAWSSISGSFDMPCKMLFFLSLFLFMSLICRPILFKKSMKRFNVAWWAYSYPLTFLALASAEYAQQVKAVTATALMFILSALSVVVFLGIFVVTAISSDTLLRGNDPCLSSTGSIVDTN